MYERLLQVDDLTRIDHTYIQPEDICYHLGEFTAHAGYSHSETNQLINNLKKSMDRCQRPEWKHKLKAIDEIAADLRRLLGQGGIENITFIPVPPSKAPGDPMYDDRLVKILRSMGAGYNMDVRELVVQRNSMQASHLSDRRPSPQELYDNMRIDEGAVLPPLRQVIVFDDVLTTGAHYKAVQRRLIERFPGLHVIGLFVARRIISNNAAAADFA